MLRLLLFRFWPVLIPLLIYAVWLRRKRRKAIAQGLTPPRFTEGPLAWIVIASMVIAIGCFLLLGSENAPNQGTYIAPRMENGRLVPGHFVP